jgi:hypothetical protein
VKLIRREDTVKYTRAQRVKWCGYLSRMEKTKTARKISEWNPIAMRSKGRPKNRLEVEVLNAFNKLKVKNGTYLVKGRKARYELVLKSKTHKGPSCHENKTIPFYFPNISDVHACALTITRLHFPYSEESTFVCGPPHEAAVWRALHELPHHPATYDCTAVHTRSAQLYTQYHALLLTV